MSRKSLLVVGITLVLLALGAWGVMGQEGGQFTEVPIFTTASNVVGVGTYVAGEAYGIAAGDDPAAAPAQAFIFPYGITHNAELEAPEDFVQPESLIPDFTYTWSLEVPDGSASTLVEGPVALFLADVAGEYQLTLTVTDPAGNVAETTWSVLATTYVGNGYLEGPQSDESQCVDCHEDVVAEWSETGHASMLTRALNGTLSSHYGPDCVECHTTGFNNRPEAVNGGFDDVAAEAGWTFPAELGDGVWDAFVADYPQVAGMANIQCESCHGPGYLHVFEATRRDPMISRSLAVGVCAQCHAEGTHHVYPVQWENSAHADVTSAAFWHPIGPEESECVRCHSGVGYIDYTAGLTEEEWRTDYQPITCAVCHDPHDATNPAQLRSYDTVVLPEGEFSGVGPAATCMNCHNVRRDGGAEGQVAAAVAGGSLSTPHHGNVQAELMLDMGGYTWGVDLPSSPHGSIIEGACIGCHMGATSGNDADGNPLPGQNSVGGHSFAMTSSVDGTENVAVCQQCHERITSFEGIEAFRDYDGDGTIETNAEEIAGLRELVWNAMLGAGVVETDSRPYFQVPENAGEDIFGALWNYYFTEPAGVAIHNLRYSVSLLQLTYEKLAGEPVPGGYILTK